jgi:hypothetical protein
MNWKYMTIEGEKMKYAPVSAEKAEFPNCSDKGEPLEWVKGTTQRGHWIVPSTGEKYLGEPCKLVNGQPLGKMTVTKEVAKPLYVDAAEAEDLVGDKKVDIKKYLVVSEKLHSKLKGTNKAIKFAASFGKGDRASICYILPSDLYEGYLIMTVGAGQLSEKISELVSEEEELKKNKALLDAATNATENINRMSPEDLVKL